MISLNLEQKCLIELIKASLFGISPVIPENAIWENVLESAKKQCIVPLVTSSVPKDHRDEWSMLSARFKAYFMQMIYAQNSLVKLLFENNIPFVILKGTAASIYYPTPFLRTFGDIDFYVAEELVDHVINLLKNNGYVFVSNDDRHYEFEKFGIDFELHFKFSCNHYNDVDSFILNGLNNAVEYKIDKNVFLGLPVCENGLVLLGHIMQHLKTSGLGLRQIIDWMMFVHKELDDSTWENHFRTYAIEAGLEKLAVTVTCMCKKWLGLPDSITWCDNADNVVVDQLFMRLLNEGNLGCESTPYDTVKRNIKTMGLFKYLQWSGRTNWRLSQKCIILRPFAWLYQLCRYACLSITGKLTGKKGLWKDKKYMSLEELWKRLE
jgi:hypothetical protein